MSPSNHSFRSPISHDNGAHFSPSEVDGNKKTVFSALIGIQKAFRGFVVRKNLKIVREIESEVDEVELKFRADQGMDRIVSDEKERMAINEMLMRFLFRLDSVRGVRDYRKRVIRRVIALQEMVDSISTAARPSIQTLESGDRVFEIDLDADGATEDLETLDPVEISYNEDDKPDSDPVVEEVEGVETPGNGGRISKGWVLLKDEQSEAENQECAKEEDGRMKEAMERIVAENEKLKRLVASLCERSVQQSRVMKVLMERVEHLESVVEKMEKKDSSTSPASSLDK